VNGGRLSAAGDDDQELGPPAAHVQCRRANRRCWLLLQPVQRNGTVVAVFLPRGYLCSVRRVCAEVVSGHGPSDKHQSNEHHTE
jgi:hypothetical protein